MSTATLHIGDVFEVLATMPDASVDLIVTSPPFLALRSYLPADHPDKAKEIGSEPTPAAFLDTLLDLTTEWRRVLAPHGSICVELGDTYAGSGGAGGDYNADGLRDGQEKFSGSAAKRRRNGVEDNPRPSRTGRPGRDWGKSENNPSTRSPAPGWPLDKSLSLLPSLYPASLAYGRNLLNPDHVLEPWRVRNLIVWARPNPPVGALGDKVRPSTSYVTTACMSRTRYFDLDAERHPPQSGAAGEDLGAGPGKSNGSYRGVTDGGGRDRILASHPSGAPPLDHWVIPTEPYKGSHYATFPTELPRKLISLMCPRKVCRECGEPSRRIVSIEHEPNRTTNGPQSADRKHLDGGSAGYAVRADRRAETTGWTDCGHSDYRRGVVLDCFSGSGTTLAVATGMGLDAVGIDIDARNADLCRERVGMFLEVIEPLPIGSLDGV